MGVLRVIKGEDLVTKAYIKCLEENDGFTPTYEKRYVALLKALKGKRILID